MNELLKVMLIGPLPPPIGGATVLFQQLVNDLKRHKEIKPIVINTARSQDSKVYIFQGFMSVLFDVLKHIDDCHVITFHASNRGAILFGPVIYSIAKLHKKPLIIRLFGGSFDVEYKRLKLWRKVIDKTVLSADACFFETKKLVSFFSELLANKKNIMWFPNNRKLLNNVVAVHRNRKEIKRFVFISRVRKYKGIGEILLAADRVKDVSIDIYGPLFDGFTEKEINRNNVKYCGVLPPDEVVKVLKKYDVLLLPTYYEGEGYPGIILEAYFAGIPVITTNWKSIPEIVDASSGILIEPQNVEQLIEAINKIKDEVLYEKLRVGALQKAKEFDSRYWVSKFIETCRTVYANNKRLAFAEGSKK